MVSAGQGTCTAGEKHVQIINYTFKQKHFQFICVRITTYNFGFRDFYRDEFTNYHIDMITTSTITAWSRRDSRNACYFHCCVVSSLRQSCLGVLLE